LSLEIVSYRDVPLSIARKYIEKYLEKLRSIGVPDSELSTVISIHEYVVKFSKCQPEVAEELYGFLTNEIGFKQVTASMIINIVPTTLDELRMLLQFETSVPEEEVLQKILDVLRDKCGSR